MGRLRSSVYHMRNKPELIIQYDSIQKVCQNKVNGLPDFLPHHAVINLQKLTTELHSV